MVSLFANGPFGPERKGGVDLGRLSPEGYAALAADPPTTGVAVPQDALPAQEEGHDAKVDGHVEVAAIANDGNAPAFVPHRVDCAADSAPVFTGVAVWVLASHGPDVAGVSAPASRRSRGLDGADASVCSRPVLIPAKAAVDGGPANAEPIGGLFDGDGSRREQG